MLPSPRIIVIDDNPGHLRGLADGLNSYGVACLQVLFTGDVEGIRECPHVRVVFADLHLNESGASNDDTRHFTVIGGLLEQTIVPTGPYAIILWTRYADQADGLRRFLEVRLKDIPKPFCVVSLDKNAHLNAAGEVRDVDALVEALASIVQDQPQIAALLNWEERVLGASAGTVSAMIELAIAGLRPEERGQAIGRLLFRLALEAVGSDHVESDRFQAVNEALLPILADRVASLRSDADTEVWEKALEGQTPDAGLTIGEAARLNRFLHVADAKGSSGIDRGAVVRVPDSQLAEFETTFGLGQEDAAEKEFLCSGFNKRNDGFRWMLAQVQATCDFAQRRPGPLPFVLGLEMPCTAVKDSTPRGAMIKCPPFESHGIPRTLHFNTRFQLAIPAATAKTLTVEYRLREALVNDIVYQLHSYGARPGMISFREIGRREPKPPRRASDKTEMR